MSKLPIFSVLGRAIGFVVGNLLTIVRLSWFPLLLLFAGGYFYQQYHTEHMAAVANRFDRIVSLTDEQLNFMYFTYGFLLFQLVITAIIAVALHRVILFNERHAGRALYIAFGWVEILYVLMFIFFCLIFFVFVGALGFGAGFLAKYNSEWVSGLRDTILNIRDPRLIYVLIAIVLVILIPTFWFLARAYVLPPAIVANASFALGEAWRLTRRNVWRIVALNVLAICFLLIVVFAILKFAPPDLVPPQWRPEFYAAGMVPLSMESIKMMQLAQQNWLLYSAINYVGAILTGAFGVGLMSHSYKALKAGAAGNDGAEGSEA